MPKRSVTPGWLTTVSRRFYSIGLIGIGVQHFLFREFIPVIVPFWPSWLPGHTACVFVVGALLVAAGLAILFGVKSRTVAAITGLALLLLVVVDDVPSVLRLYPKHLGSWTNAIKVLAMCGGAWVVAESFEGEASALPRWLETLMSLGRFFFAWMLIAFGIDHFLYAGFVATLVPKWAGNAMFWTYFAGVALVSGGVGICVRRVSRLASLLVGGMIFLWVPMLHIPRALADPWGQLGNEWTSVFEATAFSGVAFLLAENSRRRQMPVASTSENREAGTRTPAAS
jgi:uncharacterized membrane protein